MNYLLVCCTTVSELWLAIMACTLSLFEYFHSLFLLSTIKASPLSKVYFYLVYFAALPSVFPSISSPSVPCLPLPCSPLLSPQRPLPFLTLTTKHVVGFSEIHFTSKIHLTKIGKWSEKGRGGQVGRGKRWGGFWKSV